MNWDVGFSISGEIVTILCRVGTHSDLKGLRICFCSVSFQSSSSFLSLSLFLFIFSPSLICPSVRCRFRLWQSWSKCNFRRQDTVRYLMSVCVHEWICRCVHVWADIHQLILSTEVLLGCGRQKLVPIEPPLLAVNTRRECVSSLSPSSPPSLYPSLISLSFLLTYLLIPLYPIPVSVYPLCSIHPSSSPSFPPRLLARWLANHWDGCGIKDATLSFFFSPPSLLLCLSLSPQSNFSVFPLRGL